MSRVGLTGRLLYVLGVGLFVTGFVTGSVQSLRTDGRLPSIDLFVSGSSAYINLLLARKDYDGAIEQLEMQSRLLPFDAVTCEHLGNLLRMQARPNEARAKFQRLVLLRPDYAEGHGFLGNNYLDTGYPALAARCFEQAIRLKPEFALAHNSLGVANAQLGDLAEAEKCFARAVELAPDYKDAQVNLDRARKQLGIRP